MRKGKEEGEGWGGEGGRDEIILRTRLLYELKLYKVV